MKKLKDEARRAFMLAGAVTALFALILFVAGCSDPGYEEYSGTGTTSDTGTDTASGDTYTVSTAEELLAWNKAAQLDPTLNCIIAADIDMEGYVWTPVGTSSNPYRGTFDGRGHVISNINIREHSGAYTGFIGYTGNGA